MFSGLFGRRTCVEDPQQGDLPVGWWPSNTMPELHPARSAYRHDRQCEVAYSHIPAHIPPCKPYLLPMHDPIEIEDVAGAEPVAVGVAGAVDDGSSAS